MKNKSNCIACFIASELFTIGVAEGGSWGSEEPPLGGSNRA